MEQVRSFIDPVRKKWVYHFIVSTKTNVIDKPEWYLNQTLKWIGEHIDTVDSAVKLKSQPDQDTTTCPHVKHKFILCMIELAMMRLSKDMSKLSDRIDEKNLQKDQTDAILVHTYNEVVQFTKVIRQLLGPCYLVIIEDKFDMLSVFADQKLFERICDVEWEHAEKNLNEIMSSPFKWDPVLQGDFVDEYKIPKCVDRLLMLVKSITERVECFRQLDCQFKLIELQCFLFNQFLAFLKESAELSRASGKKILSGMLFFSDESTIDLTTTLRILNGVNFLRLVLLERHFIPKNVINDLDTTLSKKANKLAQDYKELFYKLVDKVVGIYEYVGCDLQNFLNFIKPKSSHNIFEMIRDDTSRIHQLRHTEHLLQGLALGGE